MATAKNNSLVIIYEDMGCYLEIIISESDLADELRLFRSNEKSKVQQISVTDD